MLILFVGVGMDMAKIFLVVHQLQNAADASALAGAQLVKFDQVTARQQAITIAFANFADGTAVQLLDNPDYDPSGDIVIGVYYPQREYPAIKFEPITSIDEFANAVKVVARRIEGSPDGPVPLNFGPIVHIDNVGLTRDAIAMSSGGTGAGLIASIAAMQDRGCKWLAIVSSMLAAV